MTDARRVAVTGAASGIGAATSRRLMADGWRVACLDRDIAGARATAGDQGLAIEVDVADEAASIRVFAQLGDTLDAIDFHKGRAPESAMRKLRRLFLRADLDTREVRLLRGILADAQRMARLAAEPVATSQNDALGLLSDGPKIG